VNTDFWAPIGLDELVGRAALMTRVDRKYVLALPDLMPALSRLDGARILDIDGCREFGYQSVYFDTPELSSYLAAARGRRRRFKVRVRTYLDTGNRFLEVKTRDGRGSTVKHRTPYSGDGFDRDARAYTAAVLHGAGIAADPRRFEPTLTTYCRRSTLFVPATRSRVTVDTGLAWALPDGRAGVLADRAILETKSDHRNAGVDRLLWSLHRRPCSVSKYGTGLAALRPELPANRWHPVLRRHFTQLALTTTITSGS
jgi:hypothetical protein